MGTNISETHPLLPRDAHEDAVDQGWATYSDGFDTDTLEVLNQELTVEAIQQRTPPLLTDELEHYALDRKSWAKHMENPKTRQSLKAGVATCRAALREQQ